MINEIKISPLFLFFLILELRQDLIFDNFLTLDGQNRQNRTLNYYIIML